MGDRGGVCVRVWQEHSARGEGGGRREGRAARRGEGDECHVNDNVTSRHMSVRRRKQSKWERKRTHTPSGCTD